MYKHLICKFPSRDTNMSSRTKILKTRCLCIRVWSPLDCSIMKVERSHTKSIKHHCVPAVLGKASRGRVCNLAGTALSLLYRQFIFGPCCSIFMGVEFHSLGFSEQWWAHLSGSLILKVWGSGQLDGWHSNVHPGIVISSVFLTFDIPLCLSAVLRNVDGQLKNLDRMQKYRWSTAK